MPLAEGKTVEIDVLVEEVEGSTVMSMAADKLLD
jgi:predicted thioesterase